MIKVGYAARLDLFSCDQESATAESAVEVRRKCCPDSADCFIAADMYDTADLEVVKCNIKMFIKWTKQNEMEGKEQM